MATDHSVPQPVTVTYMGEPLPDDVEQLKAIIVELGLKLGEIYQQHDADIRYLNDLAMSK